MKRTRFQRLVALILCLTFAISGFAITAFAADGEDSSAEGSNDSIYDSSEILELLNSISYGEYLKEANAKPAKGEIVVDAVKDLYVEGSNAKYTIDTFEGVEAVLTPSTGTVAWKVTGVPERALYTVTLEYYANVKPGNETKADSVERVFKINGKVPFSEARYLTIKKNWVNDYQPAEYRGKDQSAATLESIKSKGEKLGLTGKIADGKLTFEYPDAWTGALVDFCEEYELRFMKLDIFNNEIRPTAKQEPEWSKYTMTDSMGFYTEAFTFVLEAGDNIISLDGKNADLAVSKIVLSPAEEVISYKDYLAKCTAAGAKPGQGAVKIEAEYMDGASDKTIYPVEDSADAMTSPHDPSRTLLNSFGGEKWQTAGQWVTYKFKVDKSGMYDIIFRFKQDVLDGMFVNRSLRIYSEGNVKEGDLGYYNGLPFEEAKTLTFNYGDDWQVTKVTDGNTKADGTVKKNDDEDTSFQFYFEEGVTYTVKFEVTLGAMADIINTVQAALDSINADYLSIIQLTGSTPDTYRDYGFSRIMPDVLIDMVRQAQVLNFESEDPAEWGVAQRLTELAGEKSSNVGTLQKISDLLLEMGRDEDEIARLLARLKSYIGTLGTFLSDAKTQPLYVDYVMVQGTEEPEPAAKANFWQGFVHEVKRFFASFLRDYDSVGVMSEVEEGSALEVWLATGRDQFQVKRSLVNSDFVNNEERGYDIPVDLKLVAAGTLLPSILANQGPDVYHGLDQGSVINYAIRSAILPVDGFDDFESFVGLTYDEIGKPEFNGAFNKAAMIVLAMDNAEGETHYYGLPESQGFAMMFVRVDILADLGIEIPQTWDDIMAAIPKLQAKNMQMGLTTDNTIHLYQMGGELFADNGMRIDLDSQIGLASFQKTCDLFTKYGFPYQYDGANRFRTGEMPIIISDYTGLYNQLKVFATEIEGSWVMVPVPGVAALDENGDQAYDANGNKIINNSAIAAVTASVIVKGCEGKMMDSAWEYIKWFTGEDCQAEYSNEMVALLGPSAKYNTANRHALERLPWTNEELQRIKAQFDSLAAVPNYPGAYIISRYTGFAFLAAYNDKEDPQQAIRSHITAINKEITRKRAEFGLETLEQGQTLADKRFDQACAAAEELKERNSKYNDLYNEVVYASKTNDSAYIKGVAEGIMAMTQKDNTLIISKGPDITKLNEKQLLYYIYVALTDAANALLTY